MPNIYPEIEKLNQIWVKFGVLVKIDRSDDLSGKGYYPLVYFNLGKEKFSLFVDDEYDDFRKNYPILNFCLVLRELEGYEFTSDYEVWCQERFFEKGSDKVKMAFENLKSVTKRAKEILGEIDSCISDWDFEMNTGAAQELRKDR